MRNRAKKMRTPTQKWRTPTKYCLTQPHTDLRLETRSSDVRQPGRPVVEVDVGDDEGEAEAAEVVVVKVGEVFVPHAGAVRVLQVVARAEHHLDGDSVL